MTTDTCRQRADSEMTELTLMTNILMSKSYTIDRKTAARLLNVALRTVDRYLANGRLSHIKNRGRVWLSKEEVIQLYNDLLAEENDTNSGTLWQTDSTDNDTDRVIFAETRTKEDSFADKQKEENDSIVYKGLYLETKEKLDQATFRIGQLESQIATMVPLLEFQKQQRVLQETAETYQKRVQELDYKSKVQASQLLSKIEEKESMLKEKDKEVEVERFNKAIFAVILFVILFLQPVLWILLK